MNLNKPESLLKGDMENCWAFAGTHGFATIQLAAVIYPKTFVLAHVNVRTKPALRGPQRSQAIQRLQRVPSLE